MRMVDVILIGKDWQFRALVRAQLIEEGVEVEAHQTTAELGSPPLHPHPKARFPKLLIADLSANENPDDDLERLAIWTKCIPVWIITGHSVVQEDKVKGRGFEALLFRPVDVRELVERIKQRVEMTA
jgi:DNA-binding response OmpR family regulator